MTMVPALCSRALECPSASEHKKTTESFAVRTKDKDREQKTWQLQQNASKTQGNRSSSLASTTAASFAVVLARSFASSAYAVSASVRSPSREKFQASSSRAGRIKESVRDSVAHLLQRPHQGVSLWCRSLHVPPEANIPAGSWA